MIAFLNHWYPEAFDEWKRTGGPPLHGTADYWDVAIEAAGNDAKTFVLNEFGMDRHAMFKEVEKYDPLTVVSMEVGRFPSDIIRSSFPRSKLAAFCSHRADDADLKGFNAVFSSFKWMPDHCRSIGVRCEYLPLAFGRPVLDRVKYDGLRDIPVCFIGGLGYNTWRAGTHTMACIADAIPEFVWYGYFQGALSDYPVALQKAFRGEAYGADMYRLLRRSRIVVNRHGEIAQFGNNCRQYEATGCGALLLTDDAGELVGHGTEDGLTFCATYRDARDAIEQIRFYLDGRGVIGGADPKRSQEFVLRDHCFENRVPKIMEVIEAT